MPRRILALAALAAAVVVGAWGCQQYNFNPVGSCIIQPGSESVTLSDISVADVLFVVDDSGSMNSKQQNLARNFAAFIFALAQENRARVASNLKPLEFHIAITTSSVFRVWGNPGTSPPTYAYSEKYDDAVNQNNNGCTTAGGGACDGTNNGQPGSCTAPAVCGGYGQCCYCVPGISVGGQPYPDGNFVGMGTCSVSGTICNPAASGGCPSGQTCQANPKVLHFTSSLPWSSWGCSANATCTTGNVGVACGTGGTCASANNCCLPLCVSDASCTSSNLGGTTATCTGGNVCSLVGQCCISPPAAIGSLISQFKQNVQVGTCGSAQEQHLQAARVAVQKALAGAQPGVPSGEWPHPGAKLVVAAMGDEDDCSSPKPTCADFAHCTAAEMANTVALSDPTGTLGVCSPSLVLQTCDPKSPTPGCPSGETCSTLTGLPDQDGCTYDEALWKAGQPYKEYKVADLYQYFASLGKPMSAAVIDSTKDGTCQYTDLGATCQPGICCDYTCTGSTSVCTNNICGGQAPGVRHIDFVDMFRSANFDAVAGSICDQQFDQTLKNIAKLVRSPSKLTLSSLPATSDITIVRITDPGGATLHVCSQATTQAQADTHTYGWWFFTCTDLSSLPPVSTVPTLCLHIDHTSGNCEANPGETYSAEYLGQLPPGGCTGASPTPTASSACAAALPLADGGPSDPNAWWCYGPALGTGTCVCKAP